MVCLRRYDRSPRSSHCVIKSCLNGENLFWDQRRGGGVPISDGVVALMYRPGWTDLALSCRVRRSGEVHGSRSRSEVAGSLVTAPGGRYRAELADGDGGRTIVICDGRVVWTVRDLSGGPVVTSQSAESCRCPFAELLNPTWLLADFGLDVTGQAEHAGRSGYSAAGFLREARGRGMPPGEHVAMLIDEELGVVLRYERSALGAQAEEAELADLRVHSVDAVDPALFAPPAGAGHRALPVAGGRGGSGFAGCWRPGCRAACPLACRLTCRLLRDRSGRAHGRQSQDRGLRRAVLAGDLGTGHCPLAGSAAALCRRPAPGPCLAAGPWHLTAAEPVSVAGRHGMRITAALSGGASARGAGPITSLPVRADHVAAVIDDDLVSWIFDPPQKSPE
jgi:hypothetical protein